MGPTYRPLNPDEWKDRRHEVPKGYLPYWVRTVERGEPVERFTFAPAARVRELLREVL